MSRWPRALADSGRWPSHHRDRYSYCVGRRIATAASQAAGTPTKRHSNGVNIGRSADSSMPLLGFGVV